MPSLPSRPDGPAIDKEVNNECFNLKRTSSTRYENSPPTQLTWQSAFSFGSPRARFACKEHKKDTGSLLSQTHNWASNFVKVFLLYFFCQPFASKEENNIACYLQGHLSQTGRGCQCHHGCPLSREYLSKSASATASTAAQDNRKGRKKSKNWIMGHNRAEATIYEVLSLPGTPGGPGGQYLCEREEGKKLWNKKRLKFGLSSMRFAL